MIEVNRAASSLNFAGKGRVMDSETQTDTTPETSAWSEFIEQRQEERIDFRTYGSLYPLGDEGTEPVSAPLKIWTVDVSTTGALVRSYAELDNNCKRVLVQLVMPQLSDSLIEGKIMRSQQDVAIYLTGKEEESYIYGIQFTHIIKKSTVPVELLTVPHIAVDDKTPTVVKIVENITRDAESQIPFLSAIGIVVVYAALMFMF